MAEEAEKSITLYGQEKEIATANLARMNMILHNNPSAEIIADNTLSRPFFKNENGKLKTFDYVVANPPFSLKNWSNGVQTSADEFDRFTGFGVPPEKNGDYAFLLHIIKSLRTNGKAAVVLPHGVLFRGNAEAEIRKNIINKGYIKGIIGLPANLFYGTGIPACIMVIDKEQAAQRKGIFMMDASKGFIKDGNKNRLREQDIRKITDVFTHFEKVPKYSRMVPLHEIADEKNDYNLNIPRYIDSQEPEDIQDIFAHLNGGIPKTDIDALHKYWQVYPSLKNTLFKSISDNYYALQLPPAEIKQCIFNHAEFKAFNAQLQQTFDGWKTERVAHFKQLTAGIHPKQEIAETADLLLNAFAGNKLVDAYDLYQQLMAYWNETMQDDLYTIALNGWQAGNTWERQVIKAKKNKEGKTGKDREVEGLEGITGRMIPPQLLIEIYLHEDWAVLQKFEQDIEELKAKIAESEEENNVEDGIFAELDKLNLASAKKFLKQRKTEIAPKEEIAVIENYIELNETLALTNSLIKTAKAKMEKAVIAQYDMLTEDEIKDIVINHKWMQHLQQALQEEQERISQNLAQRIKELAERYENTLPAIEQEVQDYESKVKMHLNAMGWNW
ncbi:N-6 DNA methylase [Parafilimonas terrae]|uniref:site-specific DNA-methyltransferase (adenine-specific) n=1 Tax=Parafilimonas terrae TaxID=1465490 RepID=A0A1I5WER3_9BACT|nr:N-6 DNA methylase [Parafilimonas terrae]SFQ18077.1 type I restriction enzyme M protein [Parafilimonas terrae]